MQSFNKLPSFGDDTLSACIQAEMKNMNIVNNDNIMKMHFQDIAFPSKLTIKSNDIDKGFQSKQIPHNSSIIKSCSNQDNSDLKEFRTNKVLKSKLPTKTGISSKLKIKKITGIPKNHSLLKINKENINSNVNYTNADTSNKDTLLKQCNNSKLSNNSGKSSITHSTTNNTTNVKLSNSSVATSNTEKSSELSSVFNIPTQDRYKLASWGLPPNILQKYVAHGVTNMFVWQVECLSKHKVIEEVRNLVYSAPTSAGKTLVAEILMIKTILERRKKVIFILPFVSVVREKMYYFQDLLCDSGVRVEGFIGGVVPPGGFAATHVAIATIEKANSLINRLMEENELVNLGAVVIDELHLVGDPNRGYLLELLLTKLRYMTFRNEDINIQLIGMSATLPNISLLAKWLDAELYETEFRPVPLNEQCKIGKNIYDNKLCLIRSLIPMPELTMDSDDIFHLCIETISDGHSVLIFCPTKNWCEKLAEQISATFYKLGQENTQLGKTLRQQLDSVLISETLEQLKRSPTGLDNILKNTVSFGVAFHHAGLTIDERDIIEGSFRSGSLRVLIATSTLSSGVNLPARRVIIRSPMFGNRLLDSLTYKQMIGRAGRMGKDTAGESILICKPSEQKAAETLLSTSLKPIQSCLETSGPLIRALLEAIASEVVYTPSDLELYTKCTLVNLNDEHNSKDPANEAIKFLIDNEFLLLQKTEEGHRWVATAFGKACLAASIPPRDGLFLLEELQKARRCFVLDTELHVVYLVTPLSSGNQIGAIDWMTFLELWKLLSESERRVGQLVGVEERFLTSAVKGVVRSGKSLNIHRRFYTALALHDLVREVPLNTVCKKYGCCRGVLQTLQQSASTFAGMITQFCKQLGWDCMELLVSQFQTRLQFGVCRELLDLLRLPMLNGLRARSLYKQGITSVADLAMANELDVERALYKALPFESEKEHNGEHESEAVKRNKMRTVFVTGKDGLTTHEAANMLVHEARTLLQNELRLQDMSWKQNEQSSVTNSSNVEISLQVQQSMHNSTKHLPIPITIENASSNFENKINSNENEILNEHVKSSDLTSQNMKKNMNSTDGKQDNCIFYENKDNKVNRNVTEDFMNSKCDLENNVVQEEKNDDIKLTDQLLQIDTADFLDSPSEKFSFDFFEDSNPKTLNNSQKKRNSESLISFKANKTNRIENFTIQPSLNDVQNTRNTSVKKLKVSDETDTVIPTCVDAVTRISDFENDIKPTVSRSPSLFNDSLKLDTQICNVLEQNIFDSLHFSEFEDFKLSGHKTSTENKINTKLQVTHSISNEIQVEKDITDKNVDSNSSNCPNSQMKHNSLSWKDDSWNEPKKITEKLNQVKDKNNEDVQVKCNIRNVKNTNVHLIETAETNNSTPKMKRNYDTNIEKSTNISDNLKRITRQRVFKNISVAKSPVANVIVFNQTRPSSLDSNKSDSDDIIIASQNVNSPATSIKMRSKLSYERKHKMYTPKSSKKISDDVEYTNTISKPIRFGECKIETTLKEIFFKNVLTNKDCSTDSVISNSDEGSPIKVAKNLQKSKISLKRTQKSSKTRLQTNQFVESIDEAINWNTINIIKIGSDRPTFNLFKREVMQQRYISLALNCELYNNTTNNIGIKMIGSINTERKKRSKKIENYVHADTKLCGVAISWENNIAYYISFSNEPDLKIPGKEQIKLLKDLLSNTLLYVKCFATKNIFKTLYECCGIIASCKFLDPKTASWLYDGNTCEKTFNEMVQDHFSHGCFIMKRIGICYDIGPGLNIKNTVPGEFRASAEAVLTWHVTDSLLDKLKQLNPTLLYTFKDIEMKTVIVLACMELSGLGISLKSLQDLSSSIRAEMVSLEERAYALCGTKFKFSSSKEVAKILGLYKGKKININKAVLGHNDHPISSIIMSWRKLNATQSKIVYPILNIAQHSSRIRGNCVTCTSTGRVSMHEPNLQNVPRDFSSEDNSFTISVRMAFIPAIGNILLSADYCQLELRILAHFSNDTTLCDIMRKPGDIFKSIAASWNHISEDQVDDKMRQCTKQLCYGMIYGMGVKTLTETLSVDEVQAKEFLESFMNTYPNISKWLKNVVQDAHTNGYVTTILNRRRMFPGLTSTIPAEKAQAERQAVNTKIQGSAADIVKKAMVNIEERIRFEFPTSLPVISVDNSTRKLRSNSRDAQQRGGYLVLQLHDELLYEVNVNDLKQIATIVKESMEQVCQLGVPLPVKLKVGPAWGDLSEYYF